MPGQWDWLRDGHERPGMRHSKAPPGRLQPPRKQHVSKILPNVTGLRTDEQLREFLERSRDGTVLVNFGSSWCSHCHQMFPHFLSLAKQFPQLKYAVAQVDYMHEATRGITYTPTFAIYKRGRKRPRVSPSGMGDETRTATCLSMPSALQVDQFFGANAQQLRDHVWLQSQDVS